MSTAAKKKKPIRTEVDAAYQTVFTWSYSGELARFRDLYAKSLTLQWHGLNDLDWSQPIQMDALPNKFCVDGVPVHESTFWAQLDPTLKTEVQKRLLGHQLSNILHGEQGALLIAGQLVGAVPDLDAKLFVATQTLDEARHVEVFSKYLQGLHKINRITPTLAQLLDRVVSSPSWLHKLVGMQVVIEGIALTHFRSVRSECKDPLLRRLLMLVTRDEARHTSFGVSYLKRIVPKLSPKERADLEDGAFEAVRLMRDPTADRSIRVRMFELWELIGLDPAETWKRIWEEVGGPAQVEVESDAIRRIIIPHLRMVGLLSERIERCFEQLCQANMPGSPSIFSDPREGPVDLYEWTIGE